MEAAVPVERNCNKELSVDQAESYLKNKGVTSVPPYNPVAGDIYVFKAKDPSCKGIYIYS